MLPNNQQITQTEPGEPESALDTILAELAQEAKRVIATLRTLLADERQVAPRTDTSR